MIYPTQIDTPRLTTRPVTLADQDIWAEFLADPEATRYLPNPEGHSPAQRAELWMERQIGRYQDGSFGLMALIHRETGAFIGQCGLLIQSIDDAHELEVGYHILPRYWRQGYAMEAARAFRDFGFENSSYDSIISIILTGNLGSQAVARRNGMHFEKEARFRELDVVVYRIHRAQWLQNKTTQAPVSR